MRLFLLFLSFSLLLFPNNPIQAQDECENGNYLETRLLGGDWGRVTLGGSSNRVREEPSTDGMELFQIPAGHIFRVNYTNVVCSDGIVWREISYIDQVGWTAESYLAVSPDYFVEPLDIVQTIDESIVIENGAISLAFTPDGTQVTMALNNGNLAWINLLDSSEGTVSLDVDSPVLSIIYHPDGSGIYATIHDDSVNIWNTNHDRVRRIESRMLLDYPAIFDMDDDWGFLANGGCLEAIDNTCSAGGIVLINPTDDSDIATLNNQYTEAVRDIDFMSQHFTTSGGNSEYAVIITSIGSQSIANSSLLLREGAIWQNSPANSRASTLLLNTVATTLEYGITFYGGCQHYDNDVCTEGYLEATSWMSGGKWSDLDPLPAEVLDVAFSNSNYPNLMRIVALTADGAVSVIDFSQWYEDNQETIQVFDDIPAQAFSISPNGSVLAIASDNQVILYDISIKDE